LYASDLTTFVKRSDKRQYKLLHLCSWIVSLVENKFQQNIFNCEKMGLLYILEKISALGLHTGRSFEDEK
jgi:hypothetical protein